MRNNNKFLRIHISDHIFQHILQYIRTIGITSVRCIHSSFSSFLIESYYRIALLSSIFQRGNVYFQLAFLLLFYEGLVLFPSWDHDNYWIYRLIVYWYVFYCYYCVSMMILFFQNCILVSFVIWWHLLLWWERQDILKMSFSHRV